MTSECRANDGQDQDIRNQIVHAVTITFNLHANGFRDVLLNDHRRSMAGLITAIKAEEIPPFHLNLMVQTGAQRANCQHSDPVQLFEEIIGHKLSELAKK